jgi:hypothetical protein
MKRFAVAVLALTLAVSCRTGRPTGAAIAPLVATSSDDAMRQLRERRQQFGGLRSLMRVRATTNGKTQSFRAQLNVKDAQRMELTAYTPVGTTALTLSANGELVSVENRIEGSEWEGNAADLARSLGFLGAGLTPAEMGMLVAGLPPRDDVQYEVDPAGLRSASFGGVVVTFDPPSFPAQHVVITRGQDRIEIEHLEVVR